MKKTFLKTLLFTVMSVLLAVCAMTSASALSTAYCTDETVSVSNYEELKAALESYTYGQNIVLKNDISITDNSNDLSIIVSKNGPVALDFNGCQLTVNSKSTRYLFHITGQAYLFLLNGNPNDESLVTFNTTMPSAAIVRADNKFCEITNINMKFFMGSSGYTVTSDSSDTSVFSVNKASKIHIYGGVLTNEMSGGNGIVIEETSENKSYLNFRIGGNAKIQSKKYCVNFDPSYVKSVVFGSGKFEGNGSYERIKVTSGSTLTVSGLWYSPEAGSKTAVYCGLLLTSGSKKITELSKSDITANKTCETINNAGYAIVLQCAAGHVQLCGVCEMAYNGIESHDNERVIGSPAGCTHPGLSNGYICRECNYSSQVAVPATGHSIKYVKEVPSSCGVDGIKAHYYCENCHAYFKDAEGKTTVGYNELIIKNNHKTEVLSYVAPSCTKEGLTSGIRCKTCGRTIQKQEIIPKTSHSYPTYWSTVSSATCEAEGIREKVCTVCKYRLTEKIRKLSHNYDKDGNCIYCGKNESDPEPENPGSSGSDTVNCSCNCHKKGILNFFFKIILFFQRIFRVNQFCKGCGVAHY